MYVRRGIPNSDVFYIVHRKSMLQILGISPLLTIFMICPCFATITTTRSIFKELRTLWTVVSKYGLVG